MDSRYVGLFMLYIILFFLLTVNIFNKKTGKDLFGLAIVSNGLFISIFALFTLLVTFLPEYFELGNAFYFFVLYVVVDYFTTKNFKLKDIFFLFTLCLIKFFVIDLFSTPTPSLMPTISVDKPYAFLKTEFGIKLPFMNNMIIQWGEPKRQDIIIFSYEDKEKGRTIPYMKRVIGIEGDEVTYDFFEKTLVVKTKEGKVLKSLYTPVDVEENGESLKLIEKNDEASHYIYLKTNDDTQKDADLGKIAIGDKILPRIVTYKVGKGEMFVMGDNRDRSYDSRFFGPVKTSTLSGKLAPFYDNVILEDKK